MVFLLKSWSGRTRHTDILDHGGGTVMHAAFSDPHCLSRDSPDLQSDVLVANDHPIVLALNRSKRELFICAQKCNRGSPR